MAKSYDIIVCGVFVSLVIVMRTLNVDNQTSASGAGSAVFNLFGFMNTVYNGKLRHKYFL